jgi:hypothetical protein
MPSEAFDDPIHVPMLANRLSAKESKQRIPSLEVSKSEDGRVKEREKARWEGAGRGKDMKRCEDTAMIALQEFKIAEQERRIAEQGRQIAECLAQLQYVGTPRATRRGAASPRLQLAGANLNRSILLSPV